MSAPEEPTRKTSAPPKDHQEVEQSIRKLKDFFDKKMELLTGVKQPANQSDSAFTHQQIQSFFHRRTQIPVHCDYKTGS